MGVPSRVPSASRLLALALSLAIGLAVPAFAETAKEPPPKPDKGTTSQLKCIDQNSEYSKRGTSSFYVQTFENKCAVRMTCAIFVHAVHAKGSTLGHTRLVLAPAGQGAVAKKTYALKVPMVGGMTTSARECRVI
jgi:hypothetical protein